MDDFCGLSAPAVEFFLSEDEPTFEVSRGAPLWVPIERDGPFFLALSLASGETATSPELKIEADSTLVCETASGDISISLQSNDDDHLLVRIATPSSVSIDLSALRGRFGRICIRAEEEAAILKWIVGRADRVGLLAARTHRARRIANETAYFTVAYDQEFFSDRGGSKEIGAYEAPLGVVGCRARKAPDVAEIAMLPAAAVQPGERAYAYAQRLLESMIGRSPPDFSAKLRALYGDRPVRILSLCSGAATIERDIIARADVPVEITLFDINEHLIGRAAAALAPYARVFGVVGDVNTIAPDTFDTTYDVVMCVSGLHHVVELESVFSVASDLLEENGEFWAVGEQIGRNGNRLWPEARLRANAAFSRLPSELRYNSHEKRTDEYIPEADFSATSFEGIRSSEIEALLLSYFEPIEIYRRNCFLWRLFESTYFANYDLKNTEHLQHIYELVAAELATSTQGGRPTELWGIYRRR